MPQFHKLLQNAETDQRKIYPWSSSKNIYNLLSILLNITISPHQPSCWYYISESQFIRYMWNNDLFVLLLFFIKIENTVYTSFQKDHITLLFINGLIFDIMNISMLAPVRSVNDWRFSWIRSVFLKSFQDGWILFCNAKVTLQKMLARKCSHYCGKYMKDWK